MSQKYFVVEISTSIALGLPLADLVCVTQFETKNICLVPGIAQFWHGVVNYKGSLLWVLDGRHFFEGTAESDFRLQKLTAAVINYRVGETIRQVAIAVRRLQGITTVQSSQLEPLSDKVSALLKETCTNVVRQAKKNVYLLDSQDLLQQLSQNSVSISI